MIEINLSGQLAVVTGASGGIGRVICRTMAMAGANVAVQYHHGKERAENLAAELRGMGVQAEIYCADITKKEEVFCMRDRIFEEMGEPQIVVDAAYIPYTQHVPILQQPEEDFKSQFESCTMQTVYMAKAFIPSMQIKKYGRFIGINSEASMLCNANWAPYSSGKRGMDGVFRTLAKEVSPDGITVNAVAPGWVITDADRAAHPADQEYSAQIPLGHRGEDQDIANAVLFLASSLSSFISGIYLPVAGGNIMPCI